MVRELYYEDFTVGQKLQSRGSFTISKEHSIAFCKEYDPQAMHIDEEAARGARFGRLIVSGWQTAAATMRLKTQTDLFHIAGGLVGLGVESLKWPRPTLPGDTLHLVVTILEKRPSNSQPGQGIVKYKAETFNQMGELAMSMTTAIIVPRRAPDA